MPKDAELFSCFWHIIFIKEAHISTKPNKKERMIMKRMMLIPVVCLLYVAMLPFPVAAWNPHAPGTVTTWGNGSTRAVLVGFPERVTPVSISAYEYRGGLAIAQDGSLYDWFGVQDVVPAQVTFPPEVLEVTAASKRYGHTLALTNDGLYAWGLNHKGQVGDGTIINQSTPVKVLLPPAVTSVTGIAAGYVHSLAITNDGLYAWGDNFNGQLGNGTFSEQSLPVKVIFPSTVTVVFQVAAGRQASYAITNDGLYAWGGSWTGQLGNGSFGKLPDGSIERGQPLPMKVLLPNKVTLVTDIEAGEYYAMAITNDGLYAWGMNQSGSLGTGGGTTALPMKVRFPRSVTVVKEIAASTDHSLAITNDGLYAWGNNSAGQLGVNKYAVFTPIKVPGEDDAVDVGTAEYSSIAIH